MNKYKSYNNYSTNRNNYYKHNQHNQHNQHTNDKNKRDIFIGEEVNNELKNELLEYIYLNIDLYQFRYSILRTIEHAQQLTHQQFYITPHFHGYNYLIVFKKLTDNIVGIYLVYRIDLKFKKNEIKLSDIKIYKLNCGKGQDINHMDNTIIDGKLIFKKEQKLFLISDIYYYCGVKLLNMKIIDKFEKYNSEINLLNQILIEYFESKIIRIYKYSDMNDLVYNRIKNSDFKINGLVFIPQRSNRIFIYINDEEFENIKTSPNLDIKNTVSNIKLPSNINLDERTLLLQKTLNVDVYEVFTLDKLFRFGICHVPNIELSHKLRTHFETNIQLITKCIYDNKFSKWKPLIL